jgi:hypothetical protein
VKAPDTVFDSRMQIVFHDSPETVLRRLRAPHSPTWSKVLVGETETMIPIVEYVNREKFEKVLDVVTDLTHKGRLPIFSDRPERLEAHIRKTVLKIIEIMREEQ